MSRVSEVDYAVLQEKNIPDLIGLWRVERRGRLVSLHFAISVSVSLDRVPVEIVSGHQTVVALLLHADLVIGQPQFEQRNDLIVHELGSDGSQPCPNLAHYCSSYALRQMNVF